MRFFYEGFPAHCYVVVLSECLWEGFCIISINQSGQFKIGSATKRVVVCNIQWNPDFSNPRFLEAPDTSNKTLFPLDLLHSSSIISPPISRTLDFSKLPITRTNFFFLWDKLTLDNSNLRKFRNNLVQMSITSTPLNKLTLPEKLFSHILSHNKRGTNLSSV